jgi:hypothetical protein
MVTQMIDSGDLDRAEAAANQPIGGALHRERQRKPE